MLFVLLPTVPGYFRLAGPGSVTAVAYCSYTKGDLSAIATFLLSTRFFSLTYILLFLVLGGQ